MLPGKVVEGLLKETGTGGRRGWSAPRWTNTPKTSATAKNGGRAASKTRGGSPMGRKYLSRNRPPRQVPAGLDGTRRNSPNYTMFKVGSSAEGETDRGRGAAGSPLFYEPISECANARGRETFQLESLAR